MKYSADTYKGLFDSHVRQVPKSLYRDIEIKAAKAEAFDRIELAFEKIRTHGGTFPVRNDEEFGLKVIEIMLDYESSDSNA